jgi:O-acetylserine/cysteine efflux transporter
MPAALPLRHFLLALAVVAVWGTNFVVIKLALGHLPPLLFAALRFGLVLFPALFFLAAPGGAAGQPGALRPADRGRPVRPALRGDERPHLAGPGLAGGAGAGVLHHRPGDAPRRRAGARFQWFALLLAAAGIVVIILHTDGSTTPLGLLLMLLAALAWAGGNIAAKQGAPANILAYVVWSSAFAVPPLVALSLFFEGWEAISAALRAADAATWAAVAYQSWGNSLFGYAAWGWLLARHPAATITPMALLVPVFGMGGAALWLDESLPPWKLAAAALVMAGLALNLLWPRLRAALA